MSEEDNIPNVFYNYPDTTLNLNQYEHSFTTSGYIKIPYINSKSIIEPNLVYNNKKYKIKNLYIFKKKYNLDIGKNYDAECIIEHVSINNPDENAYVCIALITMKHNAEKNQIDEIISQSDRKSKFVALQPTLFLNINNLLVKHKDLHKIFMNKKEDIFIFKEPIYVGTDFTQINGDGFIKLFDYDKNKTIEMIASPISNNKYEENKSNEGFTNLFSSYSSGIEGLKTINEKYMRPDEIIQFIESQYGKPGEDNEKWKKTNMLLSQIVYSVSIIAMFIVSFFGFPYLYKYFIVDLIKCHLQGQSNKQPGSINALSIFLVLTALTMGFHILFQPNNQNKMESQIMGLFIIIWTFIFGVVVFIYKKWDPSTYSLYIDSTESVFNFEIFSKIISHFIGMLKAYPIQVFSIIVFYYLLVGLLIGLFTSGGKRDLLLSIFTVYIVPLLLVIVFRFTVPSSNEILA